MMTTIIFLEKTKSTSVSFSTREDIKLDFIQFSLQRAKEKKVKVVCSCRKDSESYPPVVISKIPNSSLLTIKRNPSYEHSEDCIFHAFREQFYDTIKEKYKKGIFEESALIKKKTNIVSQLDEKQEQVRRHTFGHFCLDSFSKATSFALNSKNKQSDSIEMYSTFDYFRCLSLTIKDTTLANGKTVPDSLPSPYHKISFGILREDLNITNSSMVLNEFNPKYKKFYPLEVRVKNTKAMIIHDFAHRVHSVPYYYIAVYANRRDFKSNTSYKELIRMYIYPIYESENHSCFVNNNKEKIYAHKLFIKQIAFIKPISGGEYININKKFYPQGKPNLKHLPSFMEYRSDPTRHVRIVEVCTLMDNRKYMDELQTKEQHYGRLQREGKIQYVRVV